MFHNSFCRCFTEKSVKSIPKWKIIIITKTKIKKINNNDNNNKQLITSGECIKVRTTWNKMRILYVSMLHPYLQAHLLFGVD